MLDVELSAGVRAPVDEHRLQPTQNEEDEEEPEEAEGSEPRAEALKACSKTLLFFTPRESFQF